MQFLVVVWWVGSLPALHFCPLVCIYLLSFPTTILPVCYCLPSCCLSCYSSYVPAFPSFTCLYPTRACVCGLTTLLSSALICLLCGISTLLSLSMHACACYLSMPACSSATIALHVLFLCFMPACCACPFLFCLSTTLPPPLLHAFFYLYVCSIHSFCLSYPHIVAFYLPTYLLPCLPACSSYHHFPTMCLPRFWLFGFGWDRTGRLQPSHLSPSPSSSPS